MSYFVSYDSRDISHVNSLSNINKQSKFFRKKKLWIAFEKKGLNKNIQPGEDYVRQIQQKILQSKGAVLFVSKNFIDNSFINKYEIPLIVEKQNSDKNYKIIPVFVEKIDNEMPGLLKNIQFVNSPNTSLQYLKGSQYTIVLEETLRECKNSISLDIFNTGMLIDTNELINKFFKKVKKFFADLFKSIKYNWESKKYFSLKVTTIILTLIIGLVAFVSNKNTSFESTSTNSKEISTSTTLNNTTTSSSTSTTLNNTTTSSSTSTTIPPSFAVEVLSEGCSIQDYEIKVAERLSSTNTDRGELEVPNKEPDRYIDTSTLPSAEFVNFVKSDSKIIGFEICVRNLDRIQIFSDKYSSSYCYLIIENIPLSKQSQLVYVELKLESFPSKRLGELCAPGGERFFSAERYVLKNTLERTTIEIDSNNLYKIILKSVRLYDTDGYCCSDFLFEQFSYGGYPKPKAPEVEFNDCKDLDMVRSTERISINFRINAGDLPVDSFTQIYRNVNGEGREIKNFVSYASAQSKGITLPEPNSYVDIVSSNTIINNEIFRILSLTIIVDDIEGNSSSSECTIKINPRLEEAPITTLDCNARADDTPPEVKSYSLTKTSVNVENEPESFEVIIRITDDCSGIPPKNISVTFGDLGFNSNIERISGDPLDGTYKIIFTVPTGYKIGREEVLLFPVKDLNGNSNSNFITIGYIDVN